MAEFRSDPLWQRIEAFELDDPASPLTFTKRLARENGWSQGFARRVVAEYKRFCYLAGRAGHPVTPSDQVDQAWHLHLTYTESYWTRFCGEVLESPLHHGPTRGGATEDAKYRNWYTRTLESYARLFGEPPPAEVWPDAAKRFRHAAAFRRVDTAAHWVIPRPARRPVLLWWLPAQIGALVLAACAESATDGPLAWLGESLGLLLWIPVILVAIVVGLLVVPSQRSSAGLGSLERSRRGRGRKDGPDAPGNTGTGYFGGGCSSAGDGGSGCGGGGGGCGGGCGS